MAVGAVYLLLRDTSAISPYLPSADSTEHLQQNASEIDDRAVEDLLAELHRNGEGRGANQEEDQASTRKEVIHAPESRLDPEWATIAVTTFSPAERFANATQIVGARDIFRNRGMNPTDSYIPKLARDEITAYLDARRGPLRRLMLAVHDVARQELAVLIDRHLVRGLTYQSYLAALPDARRQEVMGAVAKEAAVLRAELEERGSLSQEQIQRNVDMIQVFSPAEALGFAPFVHRRDGDVYYGARLRDLPTTSSAAVAFKVALIETFLNLGHMMRSAGALDDARITAMLVDLEKRLDRKYPTADSKESAK